MLQLTSMPDYYIHVIMWIEASHNLAYFVFRIIQR